MGVVGEEETAAADVTAGSFLVTPVTGKGRQQVGLPPFFLAKRRAYS